MSLHERTITFTGNKLHQYVMHFEDIYGNCVGRNKGVYEQDCQGADRQANKPDLGSPTKQSSGCKVPLITLT